MEWTVEFHAEFAVEFGDLHEDVQDELAAQVELLKVAGPRLGGPGPTPWRAPPTPT